MSLTDSPQLVPQLGTHLVDARVENHHGHQGDPEVTDLKDAVEEGILHVLDEALVHRNSPFAHEVLPAEDGREEYRYWDHPYEGDHNEDLWMMWMDTLADGWMV